MLIVLLIVAICFGLLGIKASFTKGGKLPDGHISGNKALREGGISCVQSQDWEARKKWRLSIDEAKKTLNDGMN